MFSFLNIFKKKNSKKEEQAFDLLRKASSISKKIAEEDIRTDEEPYGGYLMDLELTEIKHKDIN